MTTIPIRYKVWVSVELIDENNDRYEDVWRSWHMPISLAEFDTEEEAMQFAANLEALHAEDN